ncbi:MAG TPA: hydroxymethylglutaryl-CoA lyase [Solirubrobacteraceae bacterium]
MSTAALPERVDIREEGPRDGWQNIEDVQIPTERKLAFIAALVAAGARRITVTAMVHPQWVPQLADGDDVVSALPRVEGVRYGVLVPNRHGFERARALRAKGGPIDEVGLVVSASEAHNRANVNMAIADSLAQLEPIVADAKADGLHVCGGIATVFGCSYEGRVPVARVIDIARRYAAMGADELVLGDTTGMANPLQVRDVCTRLRDEVSGPRITLHFHNTRGAGLANVLAALQVGIDSFEASYGELGGCQFARGATGNLATEDLASMLGEMGIQHGFDLPALLAVCAEMEAFLGRRLDSHLARAGPIEWAPRASAKGRDDEH